MNQLEKTPETILKDKRGFKIVHIVKCDTGAATITNNTRNIRLNAMSFPFNGPCRIHLHSIVFGSKAISFAGGDFINLSLNVSQPYAQSNIPYVSTNLLPKNNSIIYTFDTDTVVSNDLNSTYIDANLSPNSIIELNLINESGSLCSLSDIDTGYVVHLYIKARPYH